MLEIANHVDKVRLSLCSLSDKGIQSCQFFYLFIFLLNIIRLSHRREHSGNTACPDILSFSDWNHTRNMKNGRTSSLTVYASFNCESSHPS